MDKTVLATRGHPVLPHMRVSAVPPRGTGGFPAAAGASGFNAALGSFIPTPQHNINSTVTLHAAQSGTIPSSPGSFTKKLGVSRKLCPNPCDLSKAGGGGRDAVQLPPQLPWPPPEGPNCCHDSPGRSLILSESYDSGGMSDFFPPRS